MAGVINALQLVRTCIGDSDVSTLDGPGIKRLLTEVRQTERALTALRVQAGRHSDRLAQEGQAPDAGEAFLGSGDVSGAQARRDTNRARLVDDIPSLGDALDQGTIGGEHLDAISNAAKGFDEAARPLFDAAASDLVSQSDNTPVDTFKKQVQRLADKVKNDHGLERARTRRAQSEVRTWKDRDGMGHLKGVFDPEWFESIVTGIEREAAAMASSAKKSGEPVVRGSQLDAAALVELIQHGNGSKGRADITVLVDAESLANGPHEHTVRETRNGTPLAFAAIERLCCDALIRRVVIDTAGNAIDVGRRSRTATDAQWSALNAMYSTCCWAGCDRPVSWCQAHHIHEWENGGLTDLDNLVPLCSKHHHAVHEGGYTIKLLPDRTLRIFQPNGTLHAVAAPNRLDPDRVKRCTDRSEQRSSSERRLVNN